MVGVYLFVAVLSATKAFAVTHYNIINACTSAITLYINGASQGLLSANGGTTTRDFEDNFNGVIYTDANGGNSNGTIGAGFLGQDNYYYLVVDPQGFNAGVSVKPDLGATGGFCGSSACTVAACPNAFQQRQTTFPPLQSGIPPASPLAACPGGNTGYTVTFCPTDHPLQRVARQAPVLPTAHTIHPNGNPNKCLDVKADVLANGTAVQIFDCNGTPAQTWLINRGNTQVRLNATNFCLDAGSTPANGVGMKIWRCFDNLPAQEWFYTDDNRIALTGQGQCLDLTNGVLTNGNRIQTWKCTDLNTNQIWTI